MNEYHKYPKTPHLPWSSSKTDDDKTLHDCEHFIGMEVVVTLKMDGENTTIYPDYYHARSIDSNNHPSRNWCKAWHATIKNDIPEGYRICGENVYATHAIHYTDLQTYFYGFSVWDNENFCLSWDETIAWFQMIGIVPVEVIYRGPWDEKLIKKLDYGTNEGYVVRNADNFHYQDFTSNVAKNVRPKHVQTNKHWMSQPIVPNELRKR